MNISRKVRQWKTAGLIDEATAQRIEAFERSGERPIVLYTVGGLGALTIGIGIISFSLASLALVGQIYQSSTPVHEALLVWSAATLPLMLLGRSRFLGLVWCVGLAISEGATVAAWLDYLRDVIGVGKSILINVAATTLERAPWPWVGALAQTLMLAVLAFITIQNGRVRAFNALTALVALRLLLMYFEVFGSMLNTELGMITGGMLTLLLAWVWWRTSPALAHRVARVEG